MAEINLKEILNKHQFENKAFLTSNEFHTCLNAMKEVWCLAVDKCKEEVELTEFALEFMQEDASEAIDLNSIEQVKKLI